MTRRVRVSLALLALAVPGLSGCSTFTNVDRVASVNGDDITRDEFEALATDYFTHPDVFEAAPAEQGRGGGEDARALVGIVAQARLLDGVVEADALDAAAEQAITDLPADSPVREMSPEMQRLYGEIVSRPDVLAGVPVPSADTLERRYNESPASAGVLCVRHILVETEAEANDVADQLAKGVDFAELAAEVSLDPGSAADGGALPGSSGPCFLLGEATQSLVPQFTQQAIALAPGAPSAPFQSDFGWHVLVHRPWSEISDAVIGVHGEGLTGDVQYVAALLTADVDVDPAFGVWDRSRASIVPIG